MINKAPTTTAAVIGLVCSALPPLAFSLYSLANSPPHGNELSYCNVRFLVALPRAIRAAAFPIVSLAGGRVVRRCSLAPFPVRLRLRACLRCVSVCALELLLGVNPRASACVSPRAVVTASRVRLLFQSAISIYTNSGY